MLNIFSLYNSHLDNPDTFSEVDPHLRNLKHQKYVYNYPLLDELPNKLPGIYTLSGGRQIGKTTLLKQWMLKLLKNNIQPASIFFFTGEIIDDHHSLLRLLQTQLSKMPKGKIGYLIIDEVTYIRDWDKGIKFAADAKLLENIILILSGSDLTILKEARMTFPGRRGQANTKDFHLYPLSFKEYLNLTAPLALQTSDNLKELYEAFERYLSHGGYLTAINDLAMNGTIQFSTLETYSDWIRGDVLKRHKQERYLFEILGAIIKRYGSQVSWPSLAKDLSIDHPNTIANYCNLLESMDVIFIQYALMEDKLLGAPKKARKITFTDPFIYHALRNWQTGDLAPYQNEILPAIEDPILSSALVEACVANHIKRCYPTYYIKAEGEVDVAYIKNERFWPIEIKWTNQLRNKDLKQISKYPNGIIYAKSMEAGKINDTTIIPLPLALLQFG